MLMKGARLREIRRATGLKQGQVGELVGLTGAYIGELERGEKAMDARLARRLLDALFTRVDVSYSRALIGWTVSITAPIPAGHGPPGRSHEVIAKYETAEEANARAEQIKREIVAARVVFHPPPCPPSTTNNSGF